MVAACYVAGLRDALRRWPLVLVLFGVHLAAGLLFTTAAWSWLAVALDRSVATRSLLTELDATLLVDLFFHHSESLGALSIGVGLLLLLLVLLGIWFTASVVAAVGEDLDLRECLHRGLRLYPGFLRLWLLATAVNVIAVLTAYALGRGLAWWTAESASEMAFHAILVTCAALGVVLLFVAITVHDHSRIRSAAAGSGALQAYGWALRFVLIREWRAVALAATVAVTGVLAWVVYQMLGTLLVTNSGLGVALSLIWGELLLVGRMLLRVGLFAAATELQHRRPA